MSFPSENPFDDSSFEQNMPQVYRATLQQFRRVSSSFFYFNFTFALLFAAEIMFFLAFLPFLLQSTLLALALSGIFLTVFCYFVLNFYYAAKKPEQLVQLKDQFISSCRQLAKNADGHHLTIAASLMKLAAHLEEFEWQFYRTPSYLKMFQRLVSDFSAYCHWQDVLRFKQILIYAAIDEHIHQIRSTPTDLEVHASLANTYVTLSKLFIEPKRSPNPAAFRRKKEIFLDHHRTAARLAIDEFQILNHYAPNDPWVHDQLARGYRDLSQPEDEIKEMETLLQLKPLDQNLMLRLGTLYFEQGLHAKGLKIYEDLKLANDDQAKELIAIYGQMTSSLPSCEL